MGALAPRMVRTTVTFLVGAAGLAGLPPLAGFFSKDEILASAYHAGRPWLWAMLLCGAFLTAVYIFRVVFLAFFGGPRMSKEAAQHIHESPRVMTAALGILAVLTVVAGIAVGIPSAHGTAFARFLSPVFPLAEEAGHGRLSALALLILSVIVAVAGVLLAWLVYQGRPVNAEAIGRPRNWLHALLLNKYYVDELYAVLFVRPLVRVAGFCARALDLGVVDGIVNGVGRLVVGWAQWLRLVQTGYVMNYALATLLGAVAMIAFFLSR
jgi:NADH-quinone oxidoreductase subunit L